MRSGSPTDPGSVGVRRRERVRRTGHKLSATPGQSDCRAWVLPAEVIVIGAEKSVVVVIEVRKDGKGAVMMGTWGSTIFPAMVVGVTIEGLLARTMTNMRSMEEAR
jgi:hypothetical protein